MCGSGVWIAGTTIITALQQMVEPERTAEKTIRESRGGVRGLIPLRVAAQRLALVTIQRLVVPQLAFELFFLLLKKI